MNTNTKNNEIPEKALQLLPWFAVNKLTADEHAYFEETLKKYPELQEQLDQELEMIGLIAEDKSLIELAELEPAEERLKAVWNQIDSESTKIETKQQGSISFSDKINNFLDSWFSDGFNISQYARFASVAVLVISLSVLIAFVAPIFTEKNDFIPAASKVSEISNSQATTIILVGFNGTSEALGALPVLKDKLQKVEAVPGKEGMYQVSLNKKLSKTEVEDMIATLVAKKESIWFAGEAF